MGAEGQERTKGAGTSEQTVALGSLLYDLYGLRVCPADTSATEEKRMHCLCHLVMWPGCDLVGSEVTEDEPSQQIFCLCC